MHSGPTVLLLCEQLGKVLVHSALHLIEVLFTSKSIRQVGTLISKQVNLADYLCELSAFVLQR